MTRADDAIFYAMFSTNGNSKAISCTKAFHFITIAGEVHSAIGHYPIDISNEQLDFMIHCEGLF